MNQQCRWTTPLALLLTAATLVGCNVTIPKTPLDQSSFRAIRKIAVVEVRDPERYFVQHGTHPGMVFFGAIGGAVAGAHMEANAAEFTNKLRAVRDFSLGRRLTDSVVRTLEQAGYEVRRVPVEIRGPDNDEFSVDYSKIQTDADAVLNLTLKAAGYGAPTSWADYTISMSGTMEVVSVGSQGKRLYFDRFLITRSPPTLDSRYHTKSDTDPIYVSHSGPYRFANFEDLLERSSEAGTGLEEAADQVVRVLIKELCLSPCR